MDLEALKRGWRQETLDRECADVREEEIMQVIDSRAKEVRRRVRRRLRRETRYYLGGLFIALASFAVEPSLVKALYAFGVILLFGVLIGTLRYAEARVVDAPVDGSLRVTLLGLSARVEWTRRAYLAAYMVFVASAVAVLVVLAYGQWGEGWLLAAGLALGAGALAWSYSSGRRYVGRIFGRYDAELASCLEELDRA